MSFLYGKILAQNPEPPRLQCELQAFNGVPCLDKLLDSSLRSANFIQENVLGKRTLRCTSKDSNQRIRNQSSFSLQLKQRLIFCESELSSSFNIILKAIRWNCFLFGFQYQFPKHWSAIAEN
ncbi:hypothetical protein AB3S75_014891 [Citrus x aurantiifolia]